MTLPQPTHGEGVDRLHALDAVRGFALLLGIVLHASMSFLPGAQYFWLVHDNGPNAALGLAFYLPHMFRMIVFFLLAGFFARMGLQRLGTRQFIRDRARRILLPLLVGWPLVLVTITAVLVWGVLLANGGTLPEQAPPGPAFTPGDFPLTHLWFLYVLLLCYVAALAVRSVVAALDRRGRLHAWAERLVAVSIGGAPLLLAAPLALALYFQSDWPMWFGIPTPDRALYPNLPAAVGFGSAFAAGWLLHGRRDLLGLCERRWPLQLALAVVASGICLSIVGVVPAPAPAERNARTLVYAAAYALAAWSWTFALIGLAMRFLAGYSATRRYLADASYWMYLVHLPLVLALQTALAQVEWPWFVKFALLLVVAFAVMLSSYQWLVRRTFIGAVLNGRRKPRPAATASTATTAAAE